MRTWTGAARIVAPVFAWLALCAAPAAAFTCTGGTAATTVWTIRVTAVRSFADRVDVAMSWRNLSRKPLSPNVEPNGEVGYSGLRLQYADGSDFGILDATDDHPERAHVADLLSHEIEPAQMYATTLHFYYPDGMSAALRARKPASLVATLGVDASQGLAPARIRLNCGG